MANEIKEEMEISDGLHREDDDLVHRYVFGDRRNILQILQPEFPLALTLFDVLVVEDRSSDRQRDYIGLRRIADFRRYVKTLTNFLRKFTFRQRPEENIKPLAIVGHQYDAHRPDAREKEAAL